MSVMSRYIQDPKNNKCKISVFSALTTGGTGQGRIHFCFIWNGAGQDSVPPRFRETFTFRVYRGGPFCIGTNYRQRSDSSTTTLDHRKIPGTCILRTTKEQKLFRPKNGIITYLDVEGRNKKDECEIGKVYEKFLFTPVGCLFAQLVVILRPGGLGISSHEPKRRVPSCTGL